MHSNLCSAALRNWLLICKISDPSPPPSAKKRSKRAYLSSALKNCN